MLYLQQPNKTTTDHSLQPLRHGGKHRHWSLGCQLRSWFADQASQYYASRLPRGRNLHSLPDIVKTEKRPSATYDREVLESLPRDALEATSAITTGIVP